MPLTGVVVRVGKQGCHALEPLVAKLGHFTTHRAQQMFVVRHAAGCFKALEAFAEITFHDEAAAYQHFERAVYGGCAGGGALLAEFFCDIFCAEMPVRSEHYVGNGDALRRSGEVVIAQERAKRVSVGLGRLFCGGHCCRGRIGVARVAHGADRAGSAAIAGGHVIRKARAICAAV